MNLMTLQRTLQQLVRGSYETPPADEPYIQTVAASAHLTMVREVVRWWRAYGVGRFCVLTATLLKRRGAFDDTFSDFVRTEPITPYAEELGETFSRLRRAAARTAAFRGRAIRAGARSREEGRRHRAHNPVAVRSA